MKSTMLSRYQVDNEERCDLCGTPTRARIVTRAEKNYCSDKCAVSASGLDYDPAINRILIDTRLLKVIPDHDTDEP